MRSFTKFAVHGFASALLVFGFGGNAIADGHGGNGGDSVYEDITLGGGIRVRGNWFNFDDDALDNSFTEQRTRFNAHASFSDDVDAFIEMDVYDQWGNDLRQDPFAGSSTGNSSDVDLYQAYFDVGGDVALRVGRQELVYGNEWILGNNDTNSNFAGLSYDAIKLMYQQDLLSVDVFAAKLVEGNSDFAEDDTDLYGIYASYDWCENGELDAYLIILRDEALTSAAFGGTESDQYTLGARMAGDMSGLDYDVEVAYQFGDIDDAPAGDLEFNSFAVNLEVGYAFESDINPRVYFNYAYLPGSEDDEIGFRRAFSDVEYSMFQQDNSLINAHVFIWGAHADAAEDLTLGLDLKYFLIEEEVGADDDLGFEFHLYGDYDYTDFLNFRAGWAYFSPGDGAEQGNVNWLPAAGASIADDDAWNYLYLESNLTF